MVAILFRQYIFAYIFTFSAGLGLIIEYVVRFSQETPTMKGAFIRTLFMITRFITGIMVQIVLQEIKKNK